MHVDIQFRTFVNESFIFLNLFLHFCPANTTYSGFTIAVRHRRWLWCALPVWPGTKQYKRALVIFAPFCSFFVVSVLRAFFPLNNTPALFPCFRDRPVHCYKNKWQISGPHAKVAGNSQDNTKICRTLTAHCGLYPLPLKIARFWEQILVNLNPAPISFHSLSLYLLSL